MIFGQVHPLARLSAGLGAATAGTTRLRTALNKLAQLTGDKNFQPCPLKETKCSNEGDVTKTTVYALIYLIGHLAGKIPGAEDEVAKIGAKIQGGISEVPKAGPILAVLTKVDPSRQTIDTAWDEGIDAARAIADVAGEPFDDPRPKIIDFVRRNADDIAKGVEVIVKVIAALGGGVPKPPPGAVTVVSPTTGQRIAFTVPTRPSVFPPGTVAVRDPVANVFRILAPPVK
jgi:hypothetical protein